MEKKRCGLFLNIGLSHEKNYPLAYSSSLSRSVVIIIAITLLLRFYLYPVRWGLAYDQAHDAIVARYALAHGKIPLLGPFSSAGPFQTGGEWYWFIMLGIGLFPFWIQGPWVLLTLT